MAIAPKIFTIGHSTRTFDEFIDLLKQHGVEAIADVRRIPRSRRHPHFSDESLAIHLPPSGIQYLPFKALGGRRKAAPDSINTGWRNESFRGYADFMQTAEFAQGVDELVGQARLRPTAIMCAEAVPWRCHRSLIADALLVRGWIVLDVLSATQPKPHAFTRFARTDGVAVTYPAPGSSLFD